MAQQLTPANGALVARKAREQFVAKAQVVLAPLGTAIRAKLLDLAQAPVGARESQDRRDALMDFERKGSAFIQGTAKAWSKAVEPPTATTRVRLDQMNLELVGEEVMERKILSSRIALVISEKAVWDLNDLKVRMQYLDGEDQAPTDILRPEALCQLLVEQWGAADLTAEAWVLVQDVVQRALVDNIPAVYGQTNEFLIAQGVMRDIDLAARVRRGAASPSPSPRPASSSPTPAETGSGENWNAGGVRSDSAPGGFGGGGGYGGAQGGGGGQGYGGPQGGGGGQGYGGSQGGGGGQGYGGPQGGGGGQGYGGPQGGGGGQGGYGGGSRGQGGGGQGGDYAGGYSDGDTVYAEPGGHAPRSGGRTGGFFGGGGSGPGGGSQGGHQESGSGGSSGTGNQTPSGGRSGGNQRGSGQGDYSNGNGGAGGSAQSGGGGNSADTRHGAGGRTTGISDETRMLTSSPPLARVRQRATGVLGQLKRLLTDRVVGFDGPPATRPSPALAEALQHHQPSRVHDTVVEGAKGAAAAAAAEIVVYDDAAVQQVAGDLRRRTGELKKKAETSTEKATIEIVALMFQSILAEERIPPAIRVWFARLQMPVLRIAIAEPEFFGSLEHPARQLIDRMGSCVMGFNAAVIGGNAMEVEIKRVVQVIEQYPETGRRVFQLVYDEFQKFLSKYLTDNDSTQRLVTVAQQVEQKETLAIQYTIEMRSMLAELPVREEIREFLFKVWAEVLALAAVRNGPQHAETLSLKAVASELVWAASAKPNRTERAKVIQELPALLHRLRQGMTLVNIVGKDQEANIKAIGDTLADAFLSKTEAIPHERIDAMAKRLAHLEDFVADDPSTDLPLDRESIEMMLGIDASMIEVVADGGSKPSAGMLAWAAELQLGNWFALDHNGASNQVQYVWRSERKQLHLFAAPGGRSYLIQARRLAAYLQAGLLLPAEEEALTVRATRDALAKLDANPERLLQ